MNTVQCLKKSNLHTFEKFSAKRLLKFVKIIKPALKIMRRRQRTNAVTPSTCNYDVVESFQNDVNESELFQLDFKFFDGDGGSTQEVDENARNEQLEKRLLETKQGRRDDDEDVSKKSVQQQQQQLEIWRKLAWNRLSDVDICERDDEFMTCWQKAEQQVPCL